MVVKKYKAEHVEARALKAGMIVRMEIFGVHSNLPNARGATEPIFGYVQEWLENKYATYVSVQWRIAKNWHAENVMCNPTTQWEVLVGTMKGVVTRSYLDSAKVNFTSRIPGASFNVGADPEFFIEAGGKLVPAFEFLPKNDRNQYLVPYWDGPQAEFRIGTGTCLDGMVTNLRNQFLALDGRAKTYNKDAKISLRSVWDIPTDVLRTWKEDHWRFGCMPSNNVYGVTAPGSSVDPLMIPFRPAGGHMHFGNTGLLRPEVYNPVVRMLDAVIGVGCVSMFAKMDDPRRRDLYGLAGEFRLPTHGLEYRVLSNAWMAHPGIAQLVWDTARVVVRAGMANLRFVWDASDVEVQDAINHTDVQLARTLLKRNEDMLDKILGVAYPVGWSGSVAEEGKRQGKIAFMQGIEKILKDPFDIEKNWGLTRSNGHITALRNPRWTTLAASVSSSRNPQ